MQFSSILSILVNAAKNKKTISECVDMLPAKRFTVSDRIQNFPREKSMMLIDQFQNYSEIEKVFGELFGRISKIDQTDGLRITFNSEDILHIRPSGNAPEFRCYNESRFTRKALYMQKQAMEKLNTLKRLVLELRIKVYQKVAYYLSWEYLENDGLSDQRSFFRKV